MEQAQTDDGYERFVCREPAHGPRGWALVDVDWLRAIVKIRCKKCGKWHRLASQREEQE